MVFALSCTAQQESFFLQILPKLLPRNIFLQSHLSQRKLPDLQLFILKLLNSKMSAQHQQRHTQATNSNAHPGLVDHGAARRSHEEVMEAKKVKEDAKLEKEANEKLAKASKAKRIAQLKQAIDDEDNTLDISPHPQHGKKKTLQYTAMFLDISSAATNYEYLDSSNMVKDDNTDYRPKSLTPMVNQGLCCEDEDAPAKKKKKVEKPAKPLMRVQIQEARDTTHHCQEGSESTATKNLSMSASKIYNGEGGIPFQVQHLKETGRPKPKPKAHPEGRHLSTIDLGEDNTSDEDVMKIDFNKRSIMVMHNVDGDLRGRSTEASGVSSKMKGCVHVRPNDSPYT